MPSWKPDCLKASATLNQISHTIQSAKLLHGKLKLDIRENIQQFDKNEFFSLFLFKIFKTITVN